MPHRVIILSGAAACYGLYSPTAKAMGTSALCVSGLIQVTAVTVPLDFGSLSACIGTAGTVEVNPQNGARGTSGCIASTAGTVARAFVRVRPNQLLKANKVKVSIVSNAVISIGPYTMSVDQFDWAKKGSGRTFTVDGTGTYTRAVGAVLNVNASQVGGTYTGTATVTASCL